MDTETANQPSTGELKEERHPSLYLPEGDIIISAPKAEGAPTLILFRLETLSLRYHSRIFRNMLSLPGDASTNEQYDGVPRVRLTDDAEDLAGLFKAMNNPTTLLLKRSDPDIALELTGVMKLAMKYEVQTVRDIIVHHIESEWTCTLYQWEQRRQLGTNPYEAIGVPHEEATLLANHLPEPASAVRFAVDFAVPKVLPLALYELAYTPRSATWDTRGDHEACSYIPVDDDQRVVTDRYARWGLLKSPELHAILRGKDWISSEWRNFLATLQQAAARHRNCNNFTKNEADKISCCALFITSFQPYLAEALLPEYNDGSYDASAYGRCIIPEHVPDDPLTAARSLCQILPNWNMCICCTMKCQEHTRLWASAMWKHLGEHFVITPD